MLYLEWIARDKLHRFRNQLRAIKSSELIFNGTKAALERIESELQSIENLLEDPVIKSNEEFLKQHIVTTNQKVYIFTNYLGILLRSTNLRNGLEAQFSFEEMSLTLLGEPDRLVLSSEWDAVPFYIPDPPSALSSFVFIGMPAYASRNALLMPLAAHELGHAIWRVRELDGPIITTAELYLNEEIDRDIDRFYQKFRIDRDLFAESLREAIVSDCLKLVASQCQELFCDAFGASVFGESYLYAFEFFLAPGFGSRSEEYPKLADRIDYIKAVVKAKGASIQETGAFYTLTDPPRINSSLLEYADDVVSRMRVAIIKSAEEAAVRVNYEHNAGDDKNAIIGNYRIGIPSCNPKSPVEILNAAWEVLFERQAGIDESSVKAKNMELMINLCLKSLEIYEYNRLSQE